MKFSEEKKVGLQERTFCLGRSTRGTFHNWDLDKERWKSGPRGGGFLWGAEKDGGDSSAKWTLG